MRAAAVALVLILGAIVILWFGNTLNSWVLGGLIGGFAALLISIPISVTLFLYLSRRHDEKMKAEQDLPLESSEFYIEEQQTGVYEPDAGMFDDEEFEEEDEFASFAAADRNLPVPSSPRAPATRQYENVANAGAGMRPPRATDFSSSRRPPAQRQRGSSGPSFPRQASRSANSQYHTAALHIARLEAMQQQADTDPYSPTTSRRLPTVRPDQRVVGRTPMRPSSQPSRQFQKPFPHQSQYRSRKVVDGTSMPAIGNPRSLPPEGGSLAGRQNQQYGHFTEPETGQIGNSEPQTGQLYQGDSYLRTGPMRQQPRTGQIVRNAHVEEQRGDPERISGSLQNPMVRRAPYMYEDDPLRQEFAQHLDTPSVRRSSRKLHYEEAEE
jgi:hypothetical protein